MRIATAGSVASPNSHLANFITGLSDPAGLAVAPVLEPSTWAMMAAGGVALLGIMHRKRNRTA